MVCSCESPNGVSAGVLIIEPGQVARIEVDHNTSRLRSSLMASVESVPPRRCLRLARNVRVNLGSAKNALAGRGDAGTILATAFRYINFPGRRPPYPPSCRLVKFADRDRFDVTHCVTSIDTDRETTAEGG
jgi:hypothetical protein